MWPSPSTRPASSTGLTAVAAISLTPRPPTPLAVTDLTKRDWLAPSAQNRDTGSGRRLGVWTEMGSRDPTAPWLFAGLRVMDSSSPPVPSVSDETLMLAFAAGDGRAFDELVRRHQRPLFNFLYRSVGHSARAEELLQEVFLRLVRARDSYRQTARFTTWMYTIARNLTVDEARRLKLRPDLARRPGTEDAAVVDALASGEPGADTLTERGRTRARIVRAVDGLPPEQREVFLFRHVAGLSFREIADTLGISDNTVKSRMRYALEKLRHELAEVDPHAPDAELGSRAEGEPYG